jgi:peptidoglycan/LPS O-acetylase OafA/YrhL
MLTGLVLLSPAQLEDLGRSAGATSVFSSNIFFFLGSGYFDGSSELKPLLHTWSLAVEEQYYILFPFLLIFIAKRHSGRYGIWLVTIGLVLLLALKMIPNVTGRGARNVLSLAGISMMLTSIFAYTPETSFPGAAAMLPTIGTAFVIHAGAGGDTFINRMLGVRPMVCVGLHAIRTACPPLLSIDRAGETSGLEFNQAILAYVSGRPEIETVILAARWAFSTNGTRYKNESGTTSRRQVTWRG